MGSKPTSRRELLKSGAAVAGGLAALDQTPASGQTPPSGQPPEHNPASGQVVDPPMIKGTKELVEYGQRSHYVTSVRNPKKAQMSPSGNGGAYCH